jgi:glycosyltransferase involved in cell wall biosynthesis
VVGDAAEVVGPLNVEALAGAMTRLAGDAELRKRLSAAGIERSRQFTWPRTARLVQAALNDALQS